VVGFRSFDSPTLRTGTFVFFAALLPTLNLPPA
jgi:hypothetical protein